MSSEIVVTAAPHLRVVTKESIDAAAARAAYVSIPVPVALARMWPHDGRTAAGDDSSPHVTLLYMPKVTAQQREQLAEAFRAVASTWTPISVELASGVETFRDGRDASRHVISKGFHPKTTARLRTLHHDLLREARELGIEVSEFSGEKYHPHTTLAYTSEPEWHGMIPHGGWMATAATLHHEGAYDLALPFGGGRTLGAAAAPRTAGRARYQAGEVAGEFPIERAQAGDSVRFNADFEKLADPESEADPDDAAEHLDGTVLRGTPGEITEVYPDGPSLLVRTTLRRTDGSMVPDVIEVPPEAVTLVLAGGDPRAKSAAREVADRVFRRAGWVSPPVVAIAVLHAAVHRRVAAADRAQALGVVGELAVVGEDTWARWAATTPTMLGRVPLRRVAGLGPRSVELVRWALSALGESGKRALGHPLDPNSRSDALWALQAIRADLEHGLPEHVYADLEERMSVQSAIRELDRALAEVEAIPEDDWAASGAQETPVDRALAVLDQHYKALSRRTRARMDFEKAKRARPAPGAAGPEAEAAVQRILDAERAYGMAELWVRAVEDWLAKLPPEDLAEARRRREPVTAPFEERLPIPETRALEVEDDVGLPGVPMGYGHHGPAEPAEPEPAPLAAEPPEASAEPEAPAGLPTLIWGYAGFMDRQEWRYERVQAKPGLKVRNKNEGATGVVTALIDPYTLQVKTDDGRNAYWQATETAVDPSVKSPLPMASKDELKAWRAGLRGIAAGRVGTAIATIAAGLEAPGEVATAWVRAAQRDGMVAWAGSLEGLTAEVEATHHRMVHAGVPSTPSAPAPVGALGARGLPRSAQEAAVWMLLPVQPGATRLPVARELIMRALIEGSVVHGPGGVDYSYVQGQNEVESEDGKKALVYAEQAQAYQAFLDTMLRPWLKLHAEDEAALPVAQLDKMYRDGVGG